nr:hypothetical protein [Tanacetum cinerariifolium]
MNELVNDGIKLSKLEINTGFINGLPKKWLSFYQSLKNTNHVKESELASLFDSPNDEEDIRDSQEYLNDLKEEFQERSLMAKSKRFFKKGSQRFSGAKGTDETNATNVKPKLRPTKEFKANYNKVKAKLALLSSSVPLDDNELVKVKVLMELADDESVAVSKESAKNGEWVKILMKKCINEQIPNQNKTNLGVDQLIEDPSSSWHKDLVFVKSSAGDTKVSMSISGVERPWLSETEGFILPNHDTGRILPAESQVKIINPLVAIINFSATEYDSTDESSVCSTSLPLLENLAGVEPVSGPKTTKSILKSNLHSKLKV